ncbi:MAG: magnesium transporter CorA family protein [Actinobacteria bacterium]|nr:magnesium transporter CorA family protein [Actinomycetota bacterium]
MLNIFKTDSSGALIELEDFEPGAWIDLVSPTDEELHRVTEGLDIPLAFLRGPLDAEEKSRIDVEDDLTHVIVDIPIIERVGGERGYDTIPLGMLLHRDYFITTCLQPNPILGEFERGTVRSFATFKKTRFLLQILLQVSTFYLRYLGRIDRETDKIERGLRQSMKNEELFDLLTLAKALVYFSTSLRSNDAVLQKLMRTPAIKKYEEDEELLEDVIVETRQAIEMAEVYSSILSGMMDAFASIISNNLNMVMKFLASITIILSFPLMVASLYGMNVPLPFQEDPNALIFVLLISLALSTTAALIFWRKNYL